MIKAVIFDMDGVLVVNDAQHEESFAIWCTRHGMVMPENFLKTYYGMGNDDIFRGLLGRELSSEEIERYSSEKEAIYREIYAPVATPTSGLVELMEALQERGIKMAVGSSGIIENIDMVLDRCNIRKYISAISHRDAVARAKPAPDVFLYAAKLLGVSAEECFVFEDSFAGVEAARAANMRLGVLATSFPRDKHTDYDIIIDDFTQITLDDILV